MAWRWLSSEYEQTRKSLSIVRLRPNGLEVTGEGGLRCGDELSRRYAMTVTDQAADASGGHAAKLFHQVAAQIIMRVSSRVSNRGTLIS